MANILILGSKVKLDETYMKMLKYEKDVLHILHILLKTFVNRGWRYKCYFNVFSPSIDWDNYSRKKRFFFFKTTWQMSKLTKSVRRNCQHPILWCNHQNWNLSFRNFLLKYEPCIKDEELHDKQKKNKHNYVLKELALKFLHKFLTRGNS